MEQDGESVDVLVIGAGFAGLAMAVRLFADGWRNVVVVERAGDVGGTWRDNTYPGAVCDVPSHLYSYSFAPNPRWSHDYAGQAEILDYLRRCAQRFGVRPAIRFHHEVRDARWDEDRSRWSVDTTGGRFAARYLIAGTGPLSEPKLPHVPGLDRFEGPMWHSAQWDHSQELAGRRAAVVGTGASTVQFLPHVASVAAHVTVFQRHAPWVLPRVDREIDATHQRVYHALPAVQQLTRAAIYWGRELLYLGFRDMQRGRRWMGRAERAARAHLAAQVDDPDLRARLTPDYAIGCKRIVLSNDWYPTLQRANVDVVSGGLVEVGPRTVVGADGVERPADVLIFGTGFHAADPPVASLVRGRDGTLLKQRWAQGMFAYKGTTVSGFPNLFLLVGPNTGLGHTSIVYMIESQVRYVGEALAALRSDGATRLEVRADAEQRWNDRIQRDLAPTVWSAGGCDSWYLDTNGRNTTLWPGFSFQYRAAVRHFDPDAYRIGPDRTRAAIPALNS
jgi:cation diffusion facilitator CzcD-associated flavoprotein CzcO